MRLVRGVAEARETVLRRLPLEAQQLPASVQEEIRRVFGEELDAEAVVERILRDVQEEGDAAVLRYNEGRGRCPRGSGPLPRDLATGGRGRLR